MDVIISVEKCQFCPYSGVDRDKFWNDSTVEDVWFCKKKGGPKYIKSKDVIDDNCPIQNPPTEGSDDE